MLFNPLILEASSATQWHEDDRSTCHDTLLPHSGLEKPEKPGNKKSGSN